MNGPHPHIQVTFPFDSNIRYLPLVYLIPEDEIVRYPTLNALPRCLSEIAASEPMMDLLDSDAFLKDIMDATAALAFPHFGFGGWKEHYTGSVSYTHLQVHQHGHNGFNGGIVHHHLHGFADHQILKPFFLDGFFVALLPLLFHRNALVVVRCV